MSEPTPDTETSPSDGASGGDDDRLIPDEALPDDLNPAKNPLARQPDDDEDEGASPNTPSGPDAAGAAPGS